MRKRKVGRHAATGEFMSVAKARRHKRTAIVQLVPVGRRKRSRR